MQLRKNLSILLLQNINLSWTEEKQSCHVVTCKPQFSHNMQGKVCWTDIFSWRNSLARTMELAKKKAAQKLHHLIHFRVFWSCRARKRWLPSKQAHDHQSCTRLLVYNLFWFLAESLNNFTHQHSSSTSALVFVTYTWLLKRLRALLLVLQETWHNQWATRQAWRRLALAQH